jgi:hypothetical protein
MSELKPCPFCQGLASIDTRFMDQPESGYQVLCLDENCPAGATTYFTQFNTRERAIRAWNRRAPAAEQGDAEPKELYLGSHISAEQLKSMMFAVLADVAQHTQLMQFYSVTSVDALVEAQSRHIEKLQAKLAEPPSFAPNRVREG